MKKISIITVSRCHYFISPGCATIVPRIIVLRYWFMKKILGIIVLSLLLSGNVYANATVSFEMQKRFIKDGTIKKGMHANEVNEIIALKWYGGVNDQILFHKSKIDVYCGVAYNIKEGEGIGYCFDTKNILIQIWEDPISMTEHWLKKVTHKKDRKKLNRLRATLLDTKFKVW